jgi:hypothetical protein
MVSKFVGWTLTVFILISAVPAYSQTAEETVAFMMYGYDKPLRHGDKRFNLNVVKKDNCRYLVEAEFFDRVIKTLFDFSNLSEYEVKFISAHTSPPNPADPVQGGPTFTPAHLKITARGQNLFTWVARLKRSGQEANGKGNEWQIIAETCCSIERLKKAETFFRSNFCKGRAF